MKTLSEGRYQLGECPRWDEQTNTLWWVDILQHQILGHHLPTGSRHVIQLEEEIGCFALREKGGMVVGLQSGLAFIDDLLNPVVRPIVDPEADKPHQRFNDGRCDRQGRLVAGTMNGRKDDSYGTFYQLDAKLAVRQLIGKSWTCNGMAFSPDGKTLYWSDTPGLTIYQCDYDPATGDASNQREFFVVPQGWGRPDGGTVDSEGCYWSALYAGGKILRISPQGELLQTVELPVSIPTMPCFGGADYKTMFVTSACQKMTPEQLAANPNEGAVILFQVDVAGLPEVKFAG
ncbi:SMP-30/gluconolactonase/LRE family protein [Paludibacterium yongneupense]|uniref:SMP-30/gluconolactonase/LRE family protein n=1 Tax=Paludibacterium yongneupense TaxID=400061 RepID=UPI00042172FC|nr:SMP-30/gluconolactonase/LRE family protein [Paludibacterium yongneupense]